MGLGSTLLDSNTRNKTKTLEEYDTRLLTFKLLNDFYIYINLLPESKLRDKLRPGYTSDDRGSS